MKLSTKEICMQGLMVALVTISTMIFQLPMPATQGYIHLGDSMILLIAVFFGSRHGMVAGGVGSALADILTGYGYWAPFTFLIKGLMGYLVGKLADFPLNQNKFMTFRNHLASLVGIVWMILGYFIAGGFLQSSFLVAATSIPANIIQGGSGFIIYLVVGIAFFKAGVYRFAASH